MYTQILRQQLLEKDDKSLELLKGITAHDLPLLVTDLLEKFPLCDGFPHHILVRLSEYLGVEPIEQYICQVWQDLSKALRINIADTLTYIGMADETILTLAHHSSNDTFIRHAIAAGYYRDVVETSPGRMVRDPRVLRQLVEIIGHYGDPTREQILRHFLKNTNEALRERGI